MLLSYLHMYIPNHPSSQLAPFTADIAAAAPSSPSAAVDTTAADTIAVAIPDPCHHCCSWRINLLEVVPVAAVVAVPSADVVAAAPPSFALAAAVAA